MKLFNFLFDEASLLVVALISFFSGTGICFLTLSMLTITFNFDVYFYISLLCGCIASWLFTVAVYESRKSDNFYKYYEKVVEMIENADTVEKLENIFDNELQTLRKLSRGGAHTQKVKYVLGMIHGKTLGL